MFRFRKVKKSAVPVTTLYKEALVDRIARATTNDKQVVSDTLTALTASIRQALARGQQVTLIGFGTFYTRSHPAGTVHAVRTGAVMRYPVTRRPAFRAGDLLKRAVRGRS